MYTINIFAVGLYSISSLKVPPIRIFSLPPLLQTSTTLLASQAGSRTQDWPTASRPCSMYWPRRCDSATKSSWLSERPSIDSCISRGKRCDVMSWKAGSVGRDVAIPIPTHTHTRIHTLSHTHTPTRTHAHTLTLSHTHTHTLTHTHTHYTHTHTHMHTHTHTHSHTHTHTHTHPTQVYVGKAEVLHTEIVKHFECFDKKRDEIREIDDELCHHTESAGWEISVWPLQVHISTENCMSAVASNPARPTFFRFQ